MYVRKFEADSMDEALKSIKAELGPDAIILKTITNKGLKNAFKKNKIEITAAISEKNYTKKARVDAVLDEGQKEEFYSGSSKYISQMIGRHDEGLKSSGDSATHIVKNPGYGNMSLNRPVQQFKKMGQQIKSGLDDFLNVDHSDELKEGPPLQKDIKIKEDIPFTKSELKTSNDVKELRKIEDLGDASEKRKNLESFNLETKKIMEAQRIKIEELEKTLWELSKSIDKLDKKEATGIYQLRTTLRSLDIDEKFVQEIVKKATFELSEEDVQNADTVFEFALRNMIDLIPVAMPLFSTVDSENRPTITILISETSCGQTSMLHKIAALKEDSILIKNSSSLGKSNFTEKIFGLNTINTKAISEIIAETRKGIDEGRSVFIDYKANVEGVNETKKLVDGIRRVFEKVEVLIGLSAIHGELYNKKVVGRYRFMAQGMVISNLDLCLNYGAIFNILHENENLPVKFFGTGEIVPDDLESATAERILAGLFQLD